MAVCCIKCFEDNFLIDYINEKGSLGECDYCNSNDVMCIEISQLENLFRCFTQIYEITTYGEHYGYGQNADDNGEPLIDLIQNDWNLFSDNLDHDIQLNLLFDILNCNPIYRKEPLDKYEFYSIIRKAFTYVRSEEIWDEFCEKIKHENRFFLDGYWWDESISDTFLVHSKIIEAETILYRARIGGIKDNRTFKPYPINEMGMPPKEKTKNGRANPIGIPYLYVGSDPITVIAEVRPWKGADISVVILKLIEEVKILDLTSIAYFDSPFECSNLESEMRNRALLRHLSTELAKPIDPNLADIEYIPTQFLAEFIKNSGYKGLKYKSSLGPGDNLIFFGDEYVEFIKTVLYKVDDIEYKI